MELAYLAIIIACSIVCTMCLACFLLTEEVDSKTKSAIFGIMSSIILIVVIIDSHKEKSDEQIKYEVKKYEEKIKVEKEIEETKPQDVVEMAGVTGGMYLRCRNGQIWVYNSLNNTFKRIL